jgi:hypothetical protein
MVVKGFRKCVVATEEVKELKRLIEHWREPGMIRVKSCDIVPDSSNRSHTGLSIDHVHFIASNILKNGFRSRAGDVRARRKTQPHDIPVLVRGGRNSTIAVESLAFWKKNVQDEPRFPKVKVSGDRLWFTSLGNGHFTQALNLFRQESISKFTGQPFVAPPGDHALWDVLENGVSSIVLRADTPIEARRKIAGLLNDTHDYKWTVDSTGSVDISPENCYLERFTQFEAQIKAADSEALSALVQLELGIFRNTDDFPEEDVLKSKL